MDTERPLSLIDILVPIIILVAVYATVAAILGASKEKKEAGEMFEHCLKDGKKDYECYQLLK